MPKCGSNNSIFPSSSPSSSSLPSSSTTTTAAINSSRRVAPAAGVLLLLDQPIRALARFLVLLTMFSSWTLDSNSSNNNNRLFFGGAMARKLADIHWQSNNSIFDISNTEHVKRVHLLDRVTLLCPLPAPDGDPARYEYSKLFMVSRDAYEQCVLLHGDERQLGVCATPERQSSITLVFREFSPLPLAFTFRPGHSYYVITTSNGTLDGLNNTGQGGLCSSKNMRLKFDVLHTSSSSSEEEEEQKQNGGEEKEKAEADWRHNGKQTTTTTGDGGANKDHPHQHHRGNNNHRHHKPQQQRHHQTNTKNEKNEPSASPAAEADESPPPPLPFLYVIHTADTPLDDADANGNVAQHGSAHWGGQELYSNNNNADDDDYDGGNGHGGGRQGRDRDADNDADNNNIAMMAHQQQYASSASSSRSLSSYWCRHFVPLLFLPLFLQLVFIALFFFL